MSSAARHLAASAVVSVALFGTKVMAATTCDLGNLSTEEIIFASVGIALGLLYTFFGYRLFKITLALAAGTAAAGGTYLILKHHTSLAVWPSIGIGLGVGVVVAVLVFFLWLVGVFLLGACVGLLITIVLQSLRDGGLITSKVGIYILAGGLALALGIVAVLIQKFMLILLTSLGGAVGMALSIDRLAKGSLACNLELFFQSNFEHIMLTTQSKAMLGGAGALFIIGFFVQMFLTARNYDHRKGRKSEEKLVGYEAVIGSSSASPPVRRADQSLVINSYPSAPSYGSVSGYQPITNKPNIRV